MPARRQAMQAYCAASISPWVDGPALSIYSSARFPCSTCHLVRDTSTTFTYQRVYIPYTSPQQPYPCSSEHSVTAPADFGTTPQNVTLHSIRLSTVSNTPSGCVPVCRLPCDIACFVSDIDYSDVNHDVRRHAVTNFKLIRVTKDFKLIRSFLHNHRLCVAIASLLHAQGSCPSLSPCTP